MAVGVMVVVKALFARLLFLLHACFCMARVHKYQPWDAYVLTIPLIFLCIETYYTLKYKKNGEWKWFCPAVFFFLCSVVPALWILELNIEEPMMGEFDNASIEALGVIQDEHHNEKQHKAETLMADGTIISVRLQPRVWANLLEQLLLLILILGRWLLPKQHLGREKLSQLLMGYIGISADILELNEAFVEHNVIGNTFLIKLILLCWSSGVFQFAFVLTSTKNPKKKRRFDPCGPLFRTELWATFVVCFMQDLPFLGLRLFLIIGYDIVNALNIFFVCKNTLVLLLQMYKIYSICRESLCVPDQDDLSLDAASLQSLAKNEDKTQTIIEEPSEDILDPEAVPYTENKEVTSNPFYTVP